MSAKRQYFGNAAHFICADRCRFHIATLIGKYVVSSVGELLLEHKSGKFEPMGAGPELYETFVFKSTGLCQCGCGLPLIDGSEIDATRWMTAKEANDGHEKFCRKYEKLSSKRKTSHA